MRRRTEKKWKTERKRDKKERNNIITYSARRKRGLVF
jgi:hypothetical protein